MTGLVLKLAPNERVLINGAVVENGDRRSKISIKTPSANILRLRDAIHPDNANTPVRRVCYICQLVLTGDIDKADARENVLDSIQKLSKALSACESTVVLDRAAAAISEDNFYLAMKLLRSLSPIEAKLLAADLP